MEQLIDLFEQTRQQLQQILPIASDIRLSFNVGYRAVGQCIKKKGYYHIILSKLLLHCNQQQIKDIIAHELIHTCPHGMGHGKIFKCFANELRQHGYNVETRTPYDTVQTILRFVNFKYFYFCETCDKQFPTKRPLQQLDNRICPYCGGKIKQKHQ